MPPRIYIALACRTGQPETEMFAVAAVDSPDALAVARRKAQTQCPGAEVVAVLSQEDGTRMGMLLAAARTVQEHSVVVEL